MHRLAVAVTDGVPVLELAILCEVFGYERPGLADSWYDFRLCAAPGTRTAAGFAPDARYGLDELAEADTVVIPACAGVTDEPPPGLVEAVCAAHGNGARELLETTSLPVPQITERTGLGSPANLRHHFTRAVGVPPSTCRRAFSSKP